MLTHFLAQPAYPRQPPKGFIEGEYFRHSFGERYLGNQTVGESCAARARFPECPFGKSVRFHNHSVRAEDLLKGVEHTFSLPLPIEQPEEFRQNEERDKYAFSPAGCFNRRTSPLGLLGIVI